MNCLYIHRFWAIPDPDKLDEEASSVEKLKSRALNPTDDCEKKASLKNIFIIGFTTFINK